MKHLKIMCDDLVLFEDDVHEVSWTSGDAVVRVEGRTKPAAAAGNGLLDLLAAASRKKAEEAAAEKKKELADSGPGEVVEAE